MGPVGNFDYGGIVMNVQHRGPKSQVGLIGGT